MAQNLDELEAGLRDTIRELREHPERIAQYVTAVERERRANTMTINRQNGAGNNDEQPAVPAPVRAGEWTVWPGGGATREVADGLIEWQPVPFVVSPDQVISTGQQLTTMRPEYDGPPTAQQQARTYLRLALGSALQAGVSAGRAAAHLFRAVRVLVRGR